MGLKKPNSWGLYDMHGNVSERCLDWLEDYPSGHVTDPVGPSSGKYRVARGGHEGSVNWCCSSAYRREEDSEDRYGFRLVMES